MKNAAEPSDAVVRSEIAGIAEAVEALLSGAMSTEEFRRRQSVAIRISGCPNGAAITWPGTSA